MCIDSMNDLSYIFGKDILDKEDLSELNECLSAKIRDENAKQPGGAATWWCAESGKLWRKMVKRYKGERGVWASDKDFALVQRLDELTPKKILALVCQANYLELDYHLTFEFLTS